MKETGSLNLLLIPGLVLVASVFKVGNGPDNATRADIDAEFENGKRQSEQEVLGIIHDVKIDLAKKISARIDGINETRVRIRTLCSGAGLARLGPCADPLTLPMDDMDISAIVTAPSLEILTNVDLRVRVMEAFAKADMNMLLDKKRETGGGKANELLRKMEKGRKSWEQGKEKTLRKQLAR